MLHLDLLLLFFDCILCFRVRTLDDSQCEVEKKECADKDHRHKEEEDEWCVSHLVHDHDFRPAFKGNALEHIEEGPKDVVEVGDIIVGIESHLATEEAFWAS